MNFGPKNKTLYEVDMETAEITPFKTSELEADFDLANGNVFATKKEATAYAKSLNGGIVLELSALDHEAMVNSEPLRNKLRISTAALLAKLIKKNKGLENVAKAIEPTLRDDESRSVFMFLEWLENDDSEGPALTQKELCRLYKEEFKSGNTNLSAQNIMKNMGWSD